MCLDSLLGLIIPSCNHFSGEYSRVVTKTKTKTKTKQNKTKQKTPFSTVSVVLLQNFITSCRKLGAILSHFNSFQIQIFQFIKYHNIMYNIMYNLTTNNDFKSHCDPIIPSFRDNAKNSSVDRLGEVNISYTS